MNNVYVNKLKNLLLFLAIWITAESISAQGTNASITGRVVDEHQNPVIGATITVKNESTGFFTGAMTSNTGEYNILQLPLGSPYTVSVSYIGYGTQEKRNYTLNQGSSLKVDFVIREESIMMDAVEVVATNNLRNKTNTLGGVTTVTAKDLQTLPINGRNFTTLTDLSPLSSGGNLGGQIFSSTSYTIDGMTAKSPTSSGTTNRGPYLLSMEAIREFEVITNDYDVTLGRAGGGTISSVTKSGTNTLQGSTFVYHRADQLSSPYDTRGNKNNNKYAITQYGLSLGGPIVKDKLHFFLAWDQQADARPLLIADIHGTEDEIRYGITKANLDKFVEIARQKYGVASSPQTGSFDKNRNSTSLFTRLDWQLNRHNLLTIRNNYNRDLNALGVGDNSSINLFEVYGDHLSTDNSFLASLRSDLGKWLTNEAKFQYLYTLDDGRPSAQLPKNNIPRAIVENITSTIGETDYRLASIQLGGQRYLPETFRNNVFQFVNNLYYNTDRIRYTFGADLMYTHLQSKATSEMNGRFYYQGLTAFENNTPYRYAREVPIGDPTVKQGVLNTALYAQSIIKLFTGASLTVGVRGDYTHYFSNPNDNQLLQKELGLKTTHKVAAFQIQPRLQFTWDVNEQRTDIIRIGAGIFGSNMNNYAMINNLLFDGVRVLSIDISSPTYTLPAADFVEFRKNPSSIPGEELFDQSNLPKVATFNINSENTKIPTVYKFNISYNKFITNDFRIGINAYATFARNNYMYVDRNLVDQPFFRLSNEANRGVFVPASSINTQYGTTNWTQGRKSDKIGRVLELNSNGKVNTYTIVADLSYRYYKDGEIMLSYTWNDSKDNTSYNGNVANSATLYRQIVDDPRNMDKMNYSDNQFRHKVIFYGTAPSFWGISLGVRYSGIGGTRYSMVTNGNINGDFVNGNDLAFVFDPNDSKTPENIRTDINKILEDPEVENSLKTYIRNSFGKIAERNGGVNPFYGVLDIRLAKKFQIYKQNKIEASVDFFNVINMFSKKKGLSHNLGRQQLLNVKGFDNVSQNYIYSVRNNAGKVAPGGAPWQIQLGLKYTF